MADPQEATKALGEDDNISRLHTIVLAEHHFEVSDAVNDVFGWQELLNSLHVAFPEFEEQELPQKTTDELKHISSWIDEDIQEPFSPHRTDQKVLAIVPQTYSKSLRPFHSFSKGHNTTANASLISSIPSVPGLSNSSSRTVSSAELGVDELCLDQYWSRRSQIERRRRLCEDYYSNFQVGDATVPKTLTNSAYYNRENIFTLPPVHGRHGWLTEQQRKDAELTRKLCTCTNCRRRKFKCSSKHHKSVADIEATSLSSGVELTIEDAVSHVGSCFNYSRSTFEELFMVREEAIPVSFSLKSYISGAPTSMTFPTTVQSFDLKTLGGFGFGLVYSNGNEPTSGKDERDGAHPPSKIEEVQVLHFDSIRSNLLKLPANIGLEVLNRLESFLCKNEGSILYAPSGQTSTSSASAPSRCRSESNQTTNPTSVSSGKVSLAALSSATKKSDDELPQKRRKRDFSSYSDSLKEPRWACPFYKREPHTYCVRTQFGDFRKCAKSPGFQSPHRVKEHLKECHYLPYCDKCFTRFNDESLLEAHQTLPAGCNVPEQKLVHGLTKAQIQQLARRNPRNKSAKEQWDTMYKICFPNDVDVPDGHYVHYSRSVALMCRDIMEIMSRYRSNVFLPGMGDLLRDLDTYLNSQQWQAAGQPSGLLAGVPPPASPEPRFYGDSDSSRLGRERHDRRQTNDSNAQGSNRLPACPSALVIGMDAISPRIVSRIDDFDLNANETTPQDASITASSTTQNRVGLYAGSHDGRNSPGQNAGAVALEDDMQAIDSQNMENLIISPSPEESVEAPDPNFWDRARRDMEETQYLDMEAYNSSDSLDWS